MGEISRVEYHSGYRKVKRPGLLGPLLDLISPKYESTGYCGFMAITDDDEVILSSQDGLTWTERTAPTTPDKEQ